MYSNLTLATYDKPNVVVSCTVRNSGAVDAHEVAQLYVAVPGAGALQPLPIPYRSLQGFERVFLAVGEAHRLSFTLTPEQFSTVQADGSARVTDGAYTISVSGHQPGDVAGLATSNVQSGTFRAEHGRAVV